VQQAAPPSNRLAAPVSASIPRYCFDHDKYWYIIEAKMEDGTHWELSRYYHDFYDFQIALLTQFEEEAGHNGRPRTLPFMPGPVTHVTDAISNGRRQNLDDYIKKLLSMPPHIARCSLVCKLFAPRPGDFEIDPNAIDTYRFSGESQQSSGQDGSATDSRQSSQAHISASGPVYAAPTVAPNGVPSARAPHQRQQPSLSQQNSFASQSRTELQIPAMNRQASSLTQASNNSSTNAMKVKVFFQDDIIAIRVPGDVNFQQLQDKLRDRLKVNGDIVIQYRDESTNDFVNLLSDHDLDSALTRNSKLTLRVTVS
jgi:bud emergence protein 1